MYTAAMSLIVTVPKTLYNFKNQVHHKNLNKEITDVE